MTCETLKLPNGTTAIVCSGHRTRKKCNCGQIASRLCDYEIRPGKTCDKGLCARCAWMVGDKDFCLDHPREVQQVLAL